MKQIYLILFALVSVVIAQDQTFTFDGKILELFCLEMTDL
jgi:hypothetical protein